MPMLREVAHFFLSYHGFLDILIASLGSTIDARRARTNVIYSFLSALLGGLSLDPFAGAVEPLEQASQAAASAAGELALAACSRAAAGPGYHAVRAVFGLVPEHSA